MTRVIAKDGNLKYALSATDAPIGSIEAGEVIADRVRDQLQRRRSHIH